MRAQRGSGLVTQWSDPWTYVIQPLADVIFEPTMYHTGAPITDVALDWQPVGGAVRYQLQVALDPDFNQASMKDDRAVVSTRFSPQFTYLNDDFYWRVRAIDAGNNKMAWPLTPFQFTRDWPNKPTLVYPPNATSCGGSLLLSVDAGPLGHALPARGGHRTRPSPPVTYQASAKRRPPPTSPSS